jgi:hypothetical protein
VRRLREAAGIREDVEVNFEGNLVELTEDLPGYGLKRGQRGFVIEAFSEPNEAYDVEFEDENGEFVGFVYSVGPHQLQKIETLKTEENPNGR